MFLLKSFLFVNHALCYVNRNNSHRNSAITWSIWQRGPKLISEIWFADLVFISDPGIMTMMGSSMFWCFHHYQFFITALNSISAVFLNRPLSWRWQFYFQYCFEGQNLIFTRLSKRLSRSLCFNIFIYSMEADHMCKSRVWKFEPCCSNKLKIKFHDLSVSFFSVFLQFDF